jgi:hypothetical protein
MRSIKVLIAASILASTSSIAEAQLRAEPRAILGRVSGSQQERLVGAEVWLLAGDEVSKVTRTDTAGIFAFRELDARPFSLRVRRLGYQPKLIASRSLPGGEPHSIVLEPMPTDLEQIVVLGAMPASRGKLREFYRHKAQSQFGHFFDEEEIASKRLRYMSELMRFIPGARLVPGRIGSLVRFRGCRPLLWVDGIRVPGAELDEFVSLADVLAIEIYTSFAGIPAQYVDRNTNCGAIVVWLKT